MTSCVQAIRSGFAISGILLLQPVNGNDLKSQFASQPFGGNMSWRCFFFVLSLSVSCRFCLSQEVQGEIEIDDYQNSGKLTCDSYMLTVMTEFSTEPGHPTSGSGIEEFVELVSKPDGIRWRRARRHSQLYEIPPNNEYPCEMISRQWCLLEVGANTYGMTENAVEKDPFSFVLLPTVNPGCLAFPPLFDWPFLNPSTRNKNHRESFLSLFQSKLKCISASEKNEKVVSKWSYMNGSSVMWELESNQGYPSIVKCIVFPKPVLDSVPVGKPTGFVTYNKIEWQEDEFGRYPKRVSSSQSQGGSVEESSTMVLEAEFKLNVDDNTYEQELARVKKRLQELKSNKGTE
jgi:hypothetical protein